MSQEEKAAVIIANAARLNATVAGMIAENDERLRRNAALAYTEESFSNAVIDCGCAYNQVVGFLLHNGPIPG
jgi:hypothetical protein